MLTLVSHGECADGTDRRTDGRQTVTLRVPLDTAMQRNDEETKTKDQPIEKHCQ